MSNITDEFISYVKKYRETFDDCFPVFSVGDPQEAIKVIKECIKVGKKASELYPERFKIPKGTNV